MMKAIEKGYYPWTTPSKKPDTLVEKIYFWLIVRMFRATPGVNVLVGSLVSVPNQ